MKMANEGQSMPMISFHELSGEGHEEWLQGLSNPHQCDSEAMIDSELRNETNDMAVTTGQTAVGSRQFGDQCTTEPLRPISLSSCQLEALIASTLNDETNDMAGTTGQTAVGSRQFGDQCTTEPLSTGFTSLPPHDVKELIDSMLKNETNDMAVTTSQTEIGSRQFGDQCTTEPLRTTSQLPNESSEEVDGFSQQNSWKNDKIDTDSQIQAEPLIVNEISNIRKSPEAEGQQPEQGFLLPGIAQREFNKNQEHLIQPGISAPSKHIPKLTRGGKAHPVIINKATDNPVNDGQPDNTDELCKFDRDLSQKSRVNLKRKKSEEVLQNKKCKGDLTEEDKKRKKREYARQYRLDQKAAKDDLVKRNENQTRELKILRNQTHAKGLFRTDQPENQGVFESVPNNPPTTKNRFDNREFTEKVIQAVMYSCDKEKFLKFMNKWLSSKGVSEIKLNNEGPIAGVRFQEGEVEKKKRIIEFYRMIEIKKNITEDLERNGLI